MWSSSRPKACCCTVLANLVLFCCLYPRSELRFYACQTRSSYTPVRPKVCEDKCAGEKEQLEESRRPSNSNRRAANAMPNTEVGVRRSRCSLPDPRELDVTPIPGTRLTPMFKHPKVGHTSSTTNSSLIPTRGAASENKEYSVQSNSVLKSGKCWVRRSCQGYVTWIKNGHYFVGSSIAVVGKDGILRLTFREPRYVRYMNIHGPSMTSSQLG